MLSMDKDFLKVHAEPVAFHFVSVKGTMIKIKSADGSEANVYEVKGKDQNNVILMFHEWWGLNDYIKQEAERLAEQTGATVLAPDLYDGQVTSDREKAAELSGELKPERGISIIQGVIKHAGKSARIQTIGWCMGGAYSLQAAIEAGDQASGCVMYYGMPEENPERIALLKAPVLAIFAREDNWITPEVAYAFEENMKNAGKSVELKFYDADHAFANPSNPDFNKEASEDARIHVLAFLKNNF
jgi:carboxymethylenebutenolidase